MYGCWPFWLWRSGIIGERKCVSYFSNIWYNSLSKEYQIFVVSLFQLFFTFHWMVEFGTDFLPFFDSCWQRRKNTSDGHFPASFDDKWNSFTPDLLFHITMPVSLLVLISYLSDYLEKVFIEKRQLLDREIKLKFLRYH